MHSVAEPRKGIRGVYGCIVSLIDSSISSNKSILPINSINYDPGCGETCLTWQPNT